MVIINYKTIIAVLTLCYFPTLIYSSHVPIYHPEEKKEKIKKNSENHVRSGCLIIENPLGASKDIEKSSSEAQKLKEKALKKQAPIKEIKFLK